MSFTSEIRWTSYGEAPPFNQPPSYGKPPSFTGPPSYGGTPNSYFAFQHVTNSYIAANMDPSINQQIPRDLDDSRIPLKDIIQATNNFARENIIEKDYGCIVYKGELSGKKLAFVLVNFQYSLNIRHVDTLSSLPKHQNIVPFIGSCHKDGMRIFVFEHPTRGSLDKYVSSAHLTWLMRVKICLDIASGLHYVFENHSRMKIEDLSSASICLDENWQAKIQLIKPGMLIDQFGPGFSDLGVRNPSDFVPLCVQTGRPSQIYSFGVILFKLLCGRLAVTEDEDELFFSKLARRHYENGVGFMDIN